MTAFLDMATARAAAESLMFSTCSIRAKSIGQTTDPNTGAVTATPGALIYSGKCRVRPAGTQGSTTEAGAVELREYDFLVTVPFSVTGVAKGHRLIVSASPDAALVGRDIEVQDVAAGDHITARRLLCTEVS